MRPLIAASLLAAALSQLPTHAAQAALGIEYPSFMEKGAVFCTDRLDFAAWQASGRFHTRGGHDSCVAIDRLTRVALLQRQAQNLAQIRIVSGPLDFQIGWTNATLPVVPPR